jgi:hypothetical protein
MDGRDFLHVAQNLMAEPTEAECRTAVGRAYYASFNVAADLLRALGFTIPKSAAAHGDVRNRLAAARHPDIVRAAAMLGDLHSRRIRADYVLTGFELWNEHTSRVYIKSCERIIESLDKCRTDPLRSSVRDAIKEWESKIRGP